MGNFNGKFESAKQDWETPSNLFNRINDIFHFTIDLAATENNTKCKKFISEDSLSIPWKGIGWLNPPYGGEVLNRLSNWVEKAFKDSKEFQSTIVMLLPARTNTKWWHKFCMKSYEIMFIEGRPKFGEAFYGLPQPLALVVFKNGIEKGTMSGFLAFSLIPPAPKNQGPSDDEGD